MNELSGGTTGRRRGMEWRGGPVEALVIIVVPANRSGGVSDILACCCCYAGKNVLRRPTTTTSTFWSCFLLFSLFDFDILLCIFCVDCL